LVRSFGLSEWRSRSDQNGDAKNDDVLPRWGS
jgi:hypothetical protein